MRKATLYLNYFHYKNHFTHHRKATCIKIEDKSLFLSTNILGIQFLHLFLFDCVHSSDLEAMGLTGLESKCLL